MPTSDTRPSTVSRQTGGRWAGALLFVCVLLVYSPAMTGGFIWDDDQYVTQNDLLRSTDGLRRIWLDPQATPQYYPLVFSSFWIEHQLWGLNPIGYHCVNIVLHALNAVLVLWSLRMLRVPGALFAAALFAVAPLHVESVAWVTERKNVLSGLFYLLAFLSCWRFLMLRENRAHADSTRRWWYYSSALLLFACALLSKSVTCSLPAAVLLVLWWKKRRIDPRDVLLLMPMFALGIAAGVHTMFLEKHHVGAEGLDWSWSLQERFIIAGRALFFYAGKLIWPQPLVFIYPKWKIDSADVWQHAYWVSAAGVIVLLWLLRKRIGRGPLAGILYFAGTLFPALGFIDVYPMRFSFVADHFAYLASIGLISLIAACVSTFMPRARSAEPWLLLGAALLVLFSAYVTFMRCFDYRDEETLWTATLAENPHCWMASFNLAAIRLEQQRFAEASALFRNALQHEANNEPSDREQAELQHCLGDASRGLGQAADAEKHYRQAAAYYRRLAAADVPPSTEPHNNLGVLSGKLNQDEEAIRHFQTALEIDPFDSLVNRNLGELYYRQRRFADSEACFQKVLKIEPENAQAHYNLGTVALATGRRQTAIQHFQAALRLEPEFRQAAVVLRQLAALPGSSPASPRDDSSVP